MNIEDIGNECIRKYVLESKYYPLSVEAAIGSKLDDADNTEMFIKDALDELETLQAQCSDAIVKLKKCI